MHNAAQRSVAGQQQEVCRRQAGGVGKCAGCLIVTSLLECFGRRELAELPVAQTKKQASCVLHNFFV